MIGRRYRPRDISELSARSRKQYWARKQEEEERLRKLYGPE
jgi:hypothetical protein